MLTISVTILNSTTDTIVDTVCSSYTVPSGDETYTISGTYLDTIPNSIGCDSLLTINLTINKDSSASIIDTVCNSYTVPSGDETYTISGIYPDTIPNKMGCDSLLTINLTVVIVDVSVTQDSGTIRSNAAPADYQWLYCDSSFSIIPGTDQQTFAPKSTGNFAVEVTQADCKDTSNCYIVEVSGIIENSFGKRLRVYPNPTIGNISVELGDYFNNIYVNITDVSGKLIRQRTFETVNHFELNMDGLIGVYHIEIFNDAQKAVVRILKYN